MSHPPYLVGGVRRRTALLRRAGVAVVLLVSVAGPTIGGAGSPAAAATTVDFGVVGESALETFTGTPLEVAGPTDPAKVLHLYLGLVSDRSALEARAVAASDPTVADLRHVDDGGGGGSPPQRPGIDHRPRHDVVR